jgi:hypothetical protein
MPKQRPPLAIIRRATDPKAPLDRSGRTIYVQYLEAIKCWIIHNPSPRPLHYHKDFAPDQESALKKARRQIELGRAKKIVELPPKKGF